MKKIKVEISSNFSILWIKKAADENEISIKEAKKYYNNFIFRDLCNRISGKIVTLVKQGSQYFEEIDDNFPIPEICFKEVNA